MVELKCIPAWTPLFGPRKLLSSVNELIRLNSFHMTMRPQVSLDFWIAKQQSSKLNISDYDWNNLQTQAQIVFTTRRARAL